MVKRIASWLFVLALIAGGVYAWLWYRDKSAVKVSPYKTATVVKADVAAKVTATGTLSARVTVQVGSQVSGRILELFADFNSTVKKGQIIAKLDTRNLDAALLRAKATLTQARGQMAKARANLAQARRIYERTKKLKADGLANDLDVDAALSTVESGEADIMVAQGSIAAATASVSDAEINLTYATIISPIDGTVISRNVDVGQTVAASLSAPILFTIAQDLHRIQVDTFVAEADVGKVKVDMEATFTVDAYPGQKFVGTVREVRSAAQTQQNVVTYDAVLDVNNPELKLKPGMTANVTFVWAEAKMAIAIPNAALRFRAPPEMLNAAGSGRSPGASGSRAPRGDGGGGGGGKRPVLDDPKRTVWVLRNAKPEMVRVETGVTDGSKTEMKSGTLEANDELIVDYTPLDGATPSGAGALPGTAGGGGRSGGGGMRF